jgi:hypothetical protein
MLSDGFDVLMSKINKKIILMHFQAKSYFKKHPTPQSKTPPKLRIKITNTSENSYSCIFRGFREENPYRTLYSNQVVLLNKMNQIIFFGCSYFGSNGIFIFP